MNQNLLTLLGCSSSIALMLLTANPAHANTVTTQNGGAEDPATIAIEIEIVGESQEQWGTDSPSLDIYSDRIGDRAILELGCDCAGCRTQVSKMIKQSKF
ncbi:hypothetical protein BCD67_17480 [Oscillatoriales cyanobacterium USR001]|nr:hypothetical protein BCD67_17480 [Oscillatoriales cyanobacterium USR001]